MTVPDHPMKRLKGTPEARALMGHVRGHRGGKTPTTETKGASVARKNDTATRHQLAAKGVARPDGSYPIENQTDVSNAVKDWIRTGRNSSVRQWIEKRVRALDLTMPSEFGTPRRTDEIDVAKTINARTKS